MRQKRIRRTARRRSCHAESPPLNAVPYDPDTRDAEAVLDRIDSLLEAA